MATETATDGARRLPPAERRNQILQAARTVLGRDGIARFSLEEVAREAGVAATLPRHYFDSRDGLLTAALVDVAGEVTGPLLDHTRPLAERLTIYIDRLAENPWAHGLWNVSDEVPSDIRQMGRALRRRMIEDAYGLPWEEMTVAEQLANSGLIGYFSDVVSAWVAQGAQREDAATLVDVLLSGARALGVAGA